MPATPRKPVTPSRQARIDAGFTLEEIAAHLCLTPGYLAQMERTNTFPRPIARRLARKYGVRLDTFDLRHEPEKEAVPMSGRGDRSRKPPTPSRAARLEADLSLAEAAKLLNRSERYIGQLEQAGTTWPYHLAQRAAALYQCRIEAFLSRGGAIRKAGPMKADPPARLRQEKGKR